jgi:hypothetical protein
VKRLADLLDIAVVLLFAHLVWFAFTGTAIWRPFNGADDLARGWLLFSIHLLAVGWAITRFVE